MIFEYVWQRISRGIRRICGRPGVSMGVRSGVWLEVALGHPPCDFHHYNRPRPRCMIDLYLLVSRDLPWQTPGRLWTSLNAQTPILQTGSDRQWRADLCAPG